MSVKSEISQNKLNSMTGPHFPVMMEQRMEFLHTGKNMEVRWNGALHSYIQVRIELGFEISAADLLHWQFLCR